MRLSFSDIPTQSSFLIRPGTQVFGQIFDQIFGEVFDQGVWHQKIQCTVLQGQKIQCKILPGQRKTNQNNKKRIRNEQNLK